MVEDDLNPVPRATSRLQFQKDRFPGPAALASYLARLGISHVYGSPYPEARPGTTHWYDIVHHGQPRGQNRGPRNGDGIPPKRLGQVLDFVPNHMGVGGADNPWWLDVLERAQNRKLQAGSISIGSRTDATCGVGR